MIPVACYSTWMASIWEKLHEIIVRLHGGRSVYRAAEYGVWYFRDAF